MNIRDIAKIAGVSASTVSKVMNGKDNDISAKTRDKILRIIEETQYVPYLKFRDKEGLKNHLLGLIVRTDNKERENIVLSTENEARKNGYNVIVSYMDNIQDIDDCVKKMIQRNVSGLLIDSPEPIPSTSERPTVYLSSADEFDERLRATFYYKMSEAGRLATQKMISVGHKKIACIVSKGGRSIIDGYKLEMQSNDLPVQPFWIYEAETLKDAEQYGFSQSLSDNITAIVCGSWEIACSVFKVIEQSQTGIPNSISIISIGDMKILEILGDGISSVCLPSKAMVNAAVEYLIDMIENDKVIEVARRFSPTIAERNSIAPPSRQKQGEKIVIVGSMNMDIMINVSETPAKGDVQIAKSVYSYPGGKGGNQAVGVGKLGGQAHMIGCLGNDLDGKHLYSSLAENHVHMDGVLLDETRSSGKAYVTVDGKGESSIVVYPGANANLSIMQIKRCKHLFESAKYCLLSLEIPLAIAEYVIFCCKQTETEVILKPSATELLKDTLLKEIAYYVPNEHELNILVPGDTSLEEKAQILLDKGITNVIVTRGSEGCYLRNKDLSMYFEGSGFEAVDTTGGADSFISALAVYLSEGKNLVQAIAFAIYASGISVTRRGVQPALPERKALDSYEDVILTKYKEYGWKEESE